VAAAGEQFQAFAGVRFGFRLGQNSCAGRNHRIRRDDVGVALAGV
jgi:hypothetical protein